MSEFAILQWLIVSTLFFVVPFWKIFGRAGFKPALSWIALIPGGILILLWILAFAKWPILRGTEIKKE
ncbi:hypothetical protein SAMN05216412_104249 [Nitrosospira multiformis]|uniref:Uncharacterized protein n=1 Tax=Nitrosospira multiformis TaxID=1231 RepID=A0A1I0D6F4_9PROT|nr:hypothetical protein SAMN05216412_104249 [Nitrosospira multiformis]